MNRQRLMVLIVLNDLKNAAFDAMKNGQKFPALLLFYSFIDICAALADETGSSKNSEIFQEHLKKYSLSRWTVFTPYDLWAARSSLLHSYSPFGRHTEKVSGAAKAIFYYAWPEKKEEVKQALENRGHTNFLLLDVTTIKAIAVDSYNGILLRMNDDVAFEGMVCERGERLLKSLQHFNLEDELKLIDELKAAQASSVGSAASAKS